MRREDRLNETRVRILEAAFSLFSQHGFEAVRIEDIAAHAGLGKGTAYLHFAGKQDLFKNCVEHQMIPAKQAVALLDDRGDPLDLLESFYRRLAGFIATGRPGLVFRMIISESARFPELVGAYHRDIIGPVSQQLAAIAKRLNEKEGPAFAALLRHPQLLAAPVLMASLWQVVFQPVQPIDPEKFLADFAELVTGRRKGGKRL